MGDKRIKDLNRCALRELCFFKLMGEFGKAFKIACQGKTETEIESLIQALTKVADIAGEHSFNWDNEAKMIEKIATNFSNKLIATPSRDFDGMIGLETH
ncbi:unnamed protein product [Brassica napus]|uniref:(rape) hypothetical protein n=1 Tax=Brassica napus TaxID=3708 RepID=A0A816L077_BRANA|nr:unnamed protein product [Brassica napus]